MPVPVLIWVVGAVFTALAGGGVGYVARHDIAAFFVGRRIAILGQRGVGKTVLLRFLTESKAVTDYTPTRGAEQRGSGHHVAGPQTDNLYVKQTSDVSGDEMSVESWKAAFEAASHDKGLCLYLVNAKLIQSGDGEHIRRVREDAERIGEWIDALPGRRNPKLFIVATHIDHVEGWYGGTPQAKVDIEDNVRKHDAFDTFRLKKSLFVKVMTADLSRADGFIQLLDGICGELELVEKR